MSDSKEAEICCICHNSLDSAPKMELVCKHVLHTECGIGWIVTKKTCPLCRQETLARNPPRSAGERLTRVDSAVTPSVRPPLRGLAGESPTGERLPRESCFLTPCRVSTEMTRFCGWNPDDLKSRVDVTMFICRYIKNHNLQNLEDRRVIIPNTALRNLLYPASEDYIHLTYFNLQRYLRRHFLTD